MKFQIHDVGHGFCAHLQHDNGKVMLWDCGHKSDPENRPSVFLREQGIRQISKLFITNFDEDHVSDLPRLRDSVYIERLYRNVSISAEQLRALKLEGGSLSPAMTSMLNMLNQYNDFSAVATQTSDEIDFPDVSFSNYYCSYGTFTDTNNLSLVTILKLRNICVLIPGDIEKGGWEKLLQREDFRRDLGSVNVFIASHHGRESGYCREVFQYCQPDVIVFSDSNKQYSTQEMTNTYAQHASGITFNDQSRFVLTTRNDRSIWWNDA